MGVPMSQTLILAVAGRQAAQFGSRSSKAFEATGGSIGRSEDCDWVLGASGVSRVHAMIRYLNGMYFIEDRSTNGMLLNGTALVKGDPSALNDGDRLLIDTFEIDVRLGDAATGTGDRTHVAAATPPAATALDDDPLDLGLLGATPSGAGYPPARAGAAAAGIDDLLAGGSAPADLDPLSFLDPAGGDAGLVPPTPSGAATPGWNNTPGTDDHFRPPMTDAQRQVNALPENWDLTVGDFAPKPAPAAAPAPAAPKPAAPAPAASAAALPGEVEQIFRVVVDGVMEVLRARTEIKTTFRLPVTTIQRSENNPLKFAPTPEEALQKIMAPQGTAFLSGPAAFEDAFEDVRCHQMAMLAGVRAAFESLLAHFNPDRYEQEADGGSRRSAFAGKGKYWDKYRENFEGLMRDPDECFRRLFGEEFARAYEEQLSRLKSARRMQQAARRP